MSLNICTVTGRLGANPEIITLPSGKERCRFNLAVNRDYKLENGDRPVDWIQIIAWNSANYIRKTNLGKGDELTVTGRIEQYNYTTEKGEKRTAYCINAEHLYIGSKNRGKEANSTQATTEVPENAAEEDLPF